MMERKTLVIDGTTSAVTYYVAPRDASRLVGMIATVNTNQGDAAATVKAGLDAATDHILEIDFKNVDAGTPKVASAGASVTDDEKLQNFDMDTPLEVEVNLQAAGKVVIELLLDPFLIGAKDPN